MIGCAARVEVFEQPCSECLLLASGLEGVAVARLKHMLQRLHFMVRVAGSLRSARELAARFRPALVLGAGETLEQCLPALRAELAGCGAAAMASVAVLAEGSPEQVLRLMMAGVDDCLVWPFSRHLLARRLGRLPQFA